MIKRGIAIFVAVFAAIAIVVGWRYYDDNIAVKIPEFPAPTQTVWLNQNWNPDQRSWFHHADQGTQTFGMPYEWFVALDRPQIFLNGPSRLSNPAYLDRFGFIPDGGATAAAKLPVGFAHGDVMIDPTGKAWLNPRSGKPFSSVGLTCAGCHTGRLTYLGREMLVDGGPALTDLEGFRHAIGVSLLYTNLIPSRRERFDERVLGPNASAAAKDALNKQLAAVIAGGKKELSWFKAVKATSVVEGYGRLDALNRIGNVVFAVDMDNQANYAARSAPVHYPRIWDAPWFTWVQYNGSIEQPMVRNAGEALGVAAPLQLSPPNAFQSNVKFNALSGMEKQLAGSPPGAAMGFTGLHAPRWSDTALPPIDKALARQGEALYAQHCQGCHLAPTTSPAFWTSPRWTAPNAAGERYLDVELIDIGHIGTDPAQATGLATRTVDVPPGLGIGERSFGPALGQLVGKVIDHWYDAQQPPTSPSDRDRMNGFRPNGIQAPLKYKARPLDGIWATPPYLHNGAVPTLYALLSPVEDRPNTFFLGSREYDPKHVGYQTDPFKNGFKFDTNIPGNSNHGHAFSKVKGPGVIGPFLKPGERVALIEYLKTL